MTVRRRRRNIDDRLRKAQRDAISAQDAMLGFQAALYAQQTGELQFNDTYQGFRVTVDTVNGPLSVSPSFSLSCWTRLDQDNNRHCSWRMWLNVTTDSYGYGTTPYIPYQINGATIQVRLSVSYPELHTSAHQPRDVMRNNETIPPERRERIALQVVQQLQPWALSPTGQEHIRQAGLDYIRGQVVRHLNEVKGKEDQLARMQQEAGWLYLTYLDFKHKHGDANEVEKELLSECSSNGYLTRSAETAALGYRAFNDALVAGQIVADYKEGEQEKDIQAREALIQTAFGPVHVLRTGLGVVRAKTLGVQSSKEPWTPLQVPVVVGKGKQKLIYVAFNFGLAKYGAGYKREGQRSEIVFARDSIREVGPTRVTNWDWTANSKNLPPVVRKQVVALVEDLVTEWASGAQEHLKSADYSIWIQKLREAERHILGQASNVETSQAETGRAYLFYLQGNLENT